MCDASVDVCDSVWWSYRENEIWKGWGMPVLCKSKSKSKSESESDSESESKSESERVRVRVFGV